MRCQDREESIYLLAAGALPPGEAEELREHLATGCAACAGVLAAAAAAASAIARGLNPVAPPRSARERLMARVESDAVRFASGAGDALAFDTETRPFATPPADDPAIAHHRLRVGRQVDKPISPWPFRVAAAAVVLLAGLAGLQWQLAKNRGIQYDKNLTQLDLQVKSLMTENFKTQQAARAAAVASAEMLADAQTAARASQQEMELTVLDAQKRLSDAEKALAVAKTAAAEAGAGQEDLRTQLARLTADLAVQRQALETSRSALAEARATADQQAAELAAVTTAPGVRLIDLAVNPDAAGVVPPLPNAPAPRGRAFLDPAGNLNVFFADLAPPGAGKVFELWAIPTGGKPVSLGTFTTSETGQGKLTAKLPANTGALDAAAISIEPEGGSPAPTGPIPLIGEIAK